MKTFWVIILVFSVILGTLTIVANWSFPTGHEYYTGSYGERGAEIARSPSPLNNPAWVRFFQNQRDWMIAIFIIGILVAIVKLAEPDFPMNYVKNKRYEEFKARMALKK